MCRNSPPPMLLRKGLQSVVGSVSKLGEEEERRGLNFFLRFSFCPSLESRPISHPRAHSCVPYSSMIGVESVSEKCAPVNGSVKRIREKRNTEPFFAAAKVISKETTGNLIRTLTMRERCIKGYRPDLREGGDVALVNLAG